MNLWNFISGWVILFFLEQEQGWFRTGIPSGTRNCAGQGIPYQTFSTKCSDYSVDEKNQLVVTFCILYFSYNNCSTCSGQPCAHHQKLTTAWYYSLVMVCAVTAGRLSSPLQGGRISSSSCDARCISRMFIPHVKFVALALALDINLCCLWLFLILSPFSTACRI